MELMMMAVTVTNVIMAAEDGLTRAAQREYRDLRWTAKAHREMHAAHTRAHIQARATFVIPALKERAAAHVRRAHAKVGERQMYLASVCMS